MTQSASDLFISANSNAHSKVRFFVDEAGDPALFNGGGEVIVNTNGCSRYFLLGKLEVDEPDLLATKLTELRLRLMNHPYFVGVESFNPARKKTALLFHAKNDLPEVRFLVFDLLYSLGKTLRFQAVVADKLVLAEQEQAKRVAQAKYRYNPDSLYDSLVRSLFGKFHRLADRYELCVAKRGAKDRNNAFKTALEHAERDFENTFGFSRGGVDAWAVTISNPQTMVCLQAVDYFLWAVQRFYEVQRHPETGEEIHQDRYLNLLWPQIAEIHDLHFGPSTGTHFTDQRPLTLDERFGGSGKQPGQKKKKS